MEQRIKGTSNFQSKKPPLLPKKKRCFTNSFRQRCSQPLALLFQDKRNADVSPAPCRGARSPAPALVVSVGRFSASPDRLHYTELQVLQSTHRTKKEAKWSMKNVMFLLWKVVNTISQHILILFIHHTSVNLYLWNPKYGVYYKWCHLENGHQQLENKLAAC